LFTGSSRGTKAFFARLPGNGLQRDRGPSKRLNAPFVIGSGLSYDGAFG